MLFGSVWLLIISAIRGEHLLPTSAPADAWWAWAYLVTFGSVIGYTAYVWLLDSAPLGMVATYAYVNPVVAIALGAIVLHESLTWSVGLGALLVLACVAVVVREDRPTTVVVDQAAAGAPPR